MRSPLTVHPLQESEFPAWGDLVAGSPDGSPYATAEYLDLLCTSAGGRFRILGVFRGEELVGGVPLYHPDSRAGLVIGPRLLLYYLGPVLRRYETKYPSQETARLIAALGAIAEAIEALKPAKATLKGRHTLTDVRPFIARGWSAWPSYTYLVPLDDLAGQRARIEQNLRRLIDRCAADGMLVTEDDDFHAFLRLHHLTMEHHGTEAYLPPSGFRRWFELARGSGLAHLFHARLPDGTSVAAQLVLAGAHPVTHTVSAATDPAHRRLGAAAFLRWRVFETLAARRYVANDLTDAALNPVTHFKSQLGGDLVANLVVETPESWRWRTATGLNAGYRRLRGMAGSALRRIRGA